MTSKDKLDQLLDNMPASLDAVFPSLTVPSSPTDILSALKVNAECGIQVVRFLNTYAGISVKDAIAYVGAAVPSNKLVAMTFVQSTGVDISTAQTLKEAVKLKGEDSGGGLEGPSSSASLELPETLTIKQEDAPMPSALWTAQDGIIDAQSEYLLKIKDVLNAKFAGLPTISAPRDSFIKKALKLVVGAVFDELFAMIFGMLWDVVAFLRKLLTNYVTLCDAMRAENTALKSLENTKSHYALRREVMTQHFETVAAMIAHVTTLEESVSTLEAKVPRLDQTAADWDAWIAAMNTTGDDLADWLDQAFDAADVNWDYTTTTTNKTGDGGASGGGGASGSWDAETALDPSNDVPVPLPPQLPLPPSIPDKGLALIHLARFALRLLIELEKRRVDRQVGKNHEELLHALAGLRDALQEMKTKISDLKYNQNSVEINGKVKFYQDGLAVAQEG